MAKAKTAQPFVFVVVDDSEEMHHALQFACGPALRWQPCGTIVFHHSN